MSVRRAEGSSLVELRIGRNGSRSVMLTATEARRVAEALIERPEGTMVLG